MKNFPLVAQIFFIFILGCITPKSKVAKSQVKELEPVLVTAKKGAPPYRAKPTKYWEIEDTRVALSFNLKEKTADAGEWIKIHPYFFSTDSLILDAKSMRIDSVQLLKQETIENLKYRYQNDELVIDFGRKIQSTDTLELFLKYTAMPYSAPTGGSAAITDDRGLYFINTDKSIPSKPTQIWTQGESESNSHWMITIDKPNTRFTTQIELTVPDSFTTLSNGALARQIVLNNGLRKDIWKMDKRIQAYVVMFAIGKFVITKDKWRDIEVNYYLEPEYAPFAQRIFGLTPEMIEFYSQVTGVPYPWNKYSQVVVRDYISGAMENTSAALFGEYMNRNTRELADATGEDVIAHELFHEWFGDYVTCESWSNLTLNESFANYGEQLWHNFKYGKNSCDELAYNDLQRYLRGSVIRDPQLVRYNYDNREEMFDGVTYNKGGAILRYINSLCGDAAFSKAMKTYLTKNALNSAEAHDWRRALETVTGQDWTGFFNQWYYHGGHPVLEFNYEYDDDLQKLKVSVSQTQSDASFVYTLPLKAAVIYGKEKTITDMLIANRNDTFVYAYKNGKRPLIIPDFLHVLPGELKEEKAMALWFQQYVAGDDYLSKRIALINAGNHFSDSFAQEMVSIALNEKQAELRRYALAEIKSGQGSILRGIWGDKIRDMAVRDSNNLIRADAFGLLGTWRDTTAKTFMERAVYDSSYTVAGAALEALHKIDTQDAYSLALKMIHNSPRGTFEIAAWDAIGNVGNANDIALFEKRAAEIYGNKKYRFCYSLQDYIKNVKDTTSFAKGILLFAKMVTDEPNRTMRKIYGNLFIEIVQFEKDESENESKDVVIAARQKIDQMRPLLQQLQKAETDSVIKEGWDKKIKDVLKD